ncbi:hypothetical protein XENTR_v10015451 [Xenopus tropicalis]|nr:hypothetical protein XENTR_v10015451 [Xenopus tropicalis]
MGTAGLQEALLGVKLCLWASKTCLQVRDLKMARTLGPLGATSKGVVSNKLLTSYWLGITALWASTRTFQSEPHFVFIKENMSITWGQNIPKRTGFSLSLYSGLKVRKYTGNWVVRTFLDTAHRRKRIQ